MTRQRFRTQFCFIGPGSLLDRYASHSHTHLVLPHVTNEKYREFYRRKRTEGDLIILDNGAYELGGSLGFIEMGYAIEWYRPQIVALPDILLHDGEETFELCKAGIEHYRNSWPQIKWMYIPQSTPGDLQGWYKWLNLGIKELKPDWVGIPRALATDIATGPNAWLERCNAVEQLTMRGINTHALGMIGTGGRALDELEGLFWEGCCSIDNSSPIWRGVFGLYIDRPEDVDKWDREGVPVNFDAPFNISIQSYQDQVIRHNMNKVLKILGQPEIV